MAVGAALTLAAASQAVPSGPAQAHNNNHKPADASASVFSAGAGGAEIAGAGHSQASSETNPGPNRAGVSASAMESATINVGGVNVPLTDFVDYGEAGGLLSESAASSPFDARAIAGVLSGDGAVNLDDQPFSEFNAAEIDLLSLLDRAGVSGLTDLFVDQADLILGVGGAEAVAQNGQILDPDGVGGLGRYRVGEASLIMHSPKVDEAAAMIYDTIGLMDDAAEEKVNEFIDVAEIAAQLPDGTSVTAEVTSEMQEKIFQAILAEEITTKNHVLSVDFSTGTATIHLDQLMHGDNDSGDPTIRPGDLTGINQQKPNTELIDDELYPMIAETVHDLMEEVTTIAIGAVEGAMESITVDFTATNPDATATWSVNLMDDELQPVECTPTSPDGAAACDNLTNAINNAKPVVDDQLIPARDFLVSDDGDQLFKLAIDEIKTGAITVPARAALEPAIELFAKVLSVQVNHQRTRSCTNPDGSTGIDQLRLSAFSVAVLRDLKVAQFNVGNANVHVDSCVPMAEASLVEFGVGRPQVAGSGHSKADFPSDPGPNQSGVSVDLLENQSIDIGGVEVPLTDIVDFGEAGALLSESTASSPRDARAIAGVGSGDGAINLDDDPNNSEFEAAEIDLLSWLDRAGVDGLSDLFIDQADLILGVGGAEVVAQNGELLDPDGVGGLGRYRVGEASLIMHSPKIDEAAAMIYDAVGLMDDAAEDKVNELLDLSDLTAALPSGTTVTAEVTSEMQEKIFQAILAEEITTKNHVLSVDFSTGTATIHLDQLMHGDNDSGDPAVRPGDLTGINQQEPNTELIDDELYPMIAETVHDLMEEVTTIAIGAVEGAMESITVDFTAVLAPSESNSATATWSVNLMGDEVQPVECEPEGLLGSTLCTTLVAAVTLAKPLVDDLLVPARDFLVSDAGNALFELAIDNVKTGAITVPARAALEPAIELFARVFSVQVNHQRTGTCHNPDGTSSVGSLRLSSFSVALFRERNASRLDIGNARLHMPCN